MTCSVFHTPFAEYVRCATPADWAFALFLAVGSVGPVIAFCVRIAKGKIS